MNDVVGPPVGGLLFGLAVAVPFGLDALTFAGAALVMAFMTGTYTSGAAPRARRGDANRVCGKAFDGCGASTCCGPWR